MELKWNFTHFASELDYEIYYEKYNTLTAEDIIHFYGLDESDFEKIREVVKLYQSEHEATQNPEVEKILDSVQVNIMREAIRRELEGVKND